MIVSKAAWHDAARDTDGKPIVDVVVKNLCSIAETICSEKYRGGRTNLIKQQLVKAGYALGYCVYTNLRKKHKGADGNAYNSRIDEFINGINAGLRIMEAKGNSPFGAHKFRNHEWLYDVHWYRDQQNEDYMPCSLPLVAEIELGVKREIDDDINKDVPYSAVKFDFQKLLVSNADLMVMIFQCSSMQKHVWSAGGLDDYFSKAINSYPNIHARNASFLLVCYSKKKLWWKLIGIEARN